MVIGGLMVANVYIEPRIIDETGTAFILWMCGFIVMFLGFCCSFCSFCFVCRGEGRRESRARCMTLIGSDFLPRLNERYKDKNLVFSIHDRRYSGDTRWKHYRSPIWDLMVNLNARGQKEERLGTAVGEDVPGSVQL